MNAKSVANALGRVVIYGNMSVSMRDARSMNVISMDVGNGFYDWIS